MKWERVYRIGAGLHNLGNTCFLNSVVQCLTYTPPLANYLLSKEHSRTCERGGQLGGRQGQGSHAGGEMECLPVLLSALCSAPLHVALSRGVRVSGCTFSAPSCPFLHREVVPAYGSLFLAIAVFPSSASLCLRRLCLCWV